VHYYNNYPIHVSAIARHAGTRPVWEALGMIFDPETSTRELKHLQTGDWIFYDTSEEAKEIVLALCKAWLDVKQH